MSDEIRAKDTFTAISWLGTPANLTAMEQVSDNQREKCGTADCPEESCVAPSNCGVKIDPISQEQCAESREPEKRKSSGEEI
ncbi:hypothetical protein [Haladaptatus sp. DYF46]|uniref:hypothetical protein n=1 Tax=Haladaptatus sp. DYF46 TaxID=2886041 RepID=UPI001E5473C1|nr:hypothetical protein [Haladaptatus sp. DYF46]